MGIITYFLGQNDTIHNFFYRRGGGNDTIHEIYLTERRISAILKNKKILYRYIFRNRKTILYDFIMKKQLVKFLSGKHEIPNNDFAFIESSRNAEMHYHYFVEIVYFVSGKGTHTIGNETYPIQSGDIFLINPFTPHAYSTISEDSKSVLVYNVVFYSTFLHGSKKYVAEKFIDSFFLNIFKTPYNQNIEKTSYIKLSDYDKSFFALLKIIQEEYNNQQAGYLISLENLLNALLIKFYRPSLTHKKELSRNNKAIMDDAIQYLKEHATESILLKDIAKKYYFSVSYFNRLFKTHTGVTFNEFIQQERIRIATKLLQNTDLAIDVICEKAGYTDIKFFYSLFLKNIGLSPAQYRKHLRTEQSTLSHT